MTTEARAKSLQTGIRGLVKDFRKTFPGISESAAQRAAEKWVGLTVVHMDADPAEFTKAFQQHMQQEAEAGAEWATALLNAAFEGKIKPAYDKAVAVGADPVPVIMVEAGLNKAQAEEAAAKLRAKAAETGSDDLEPVDYGSENDNA